MGFQTFTCVICGESCTRRTSKRYGEGRACNKHEEVQTAMNDKLLEQEKWVLQIILRDYKEVVGRKHPVKDKLKDFLQDQVKVLRATINELSLSSKKLTIMKETKLIDLNYVVSDAFVEKTMNIIKEHESDDDWETVKKHDSKPKQAHKPRQSKEDDKEHNVRIKEHRGAKEAPRRKASDKRR